MVNEDVAETDDRIAGRPIEEAVDTVVRTRDEERQEVRAVLNRVADEDGIVRWETLETELAEASKIVATPETRVELAEIALADAKETARPYVEFDIVESRVDTFESRLSRIETAVSDLGSKLQALIQQADEKADLYHTARRLGELRTEANQLQRRADELSVDLEEFERWVTTPDQRFETLGADVDAFAESLDELTAQLETIDDALESTDSAPDTELEFAWVETALHHRALSLLEADLRTELDQLRQWANQEDASTDRADAIEDRLDSLTSTWETIGTELEAVGRSKWQSKHADRLEAFDRTLATFDPPIDWDAVYAEIEAVRPEPDA